METILYKTKGLEVDMKVFEKFESSFKEQVDAEITEDRFNNDDFDPWEGTDQVVGHLSKANIVFTDDDQDMVAIPIECWDVNKEEYVDGGFIQVQHWKEVDE